ncbi:MAG: hypothetical protein K8I30_03950 [Anaerolineae bacterium]|nr:hypothetical protein [Anaerolineae bacterium]
MEPVLLIVSTVIVVTSLALFVTFYLLRRTMLNRTAAVRERFPNAKAIISTANFYGQESKGVMQTRGTGTLVLTDTELYFEKWVPQREYRIPLSAIQAIETPSSYLGKTNFRPILKVVYRDESGGTDSMGWLVPDVDNLKRKIESARASA